MERFDAVVIGGGSIGLWSAYKLSTMGSNVALVDSSMPGGSYASAGNLGPGAGVTGFDNFAESERLEVLKTYWRLAAKSLEGFAEISRVLDVELTKAGILRAYTSEELLRKHVAVLEGARDGLGLRYDEFSSSECREREPLLSESICGGVLYPEDCWVNPAKVIEGLRGLLRARGVPLIDASVTGFVMLGSAVDHVSTTDAGELRADDFVLSAGAYAKPLAEGLGIDLPITAGRGHTLISEPVETRLNQRVLSCAELQLGINQSYASGSFRVSGNIKIKDVMSPVEPANYDDLIEAASKYLPAVKGMRWQQRLVGSLPCPPDRLPIIGRSARYDNLVLAAGHCGTGMILGPITGEMVAGIVSGSDAEIPEIFSPGRFGL